MTPIWPGKPYPLGAMWDGQGVNFALYSEHATGVELCLFDTTAAPHEYVRIALPEQTDHVWHGYLPGAQPGQLYGYRVHGPYAPHLGQHFNAHKLLVDPYARAVSGPVRWHNALSGYQTDQIARGMIADIQDSAPYMPRCVVIDPTFDWDDDRPPATPLHQSLIYELHVKGFTWLHPDVPEALRGTYAGLASPAIIAYLQSLGVTAVELLPIHQHADEHFMDARALTNYWGYNTLAFFAPSGRYSSRGTCGQQVQEFKAMVKALHAAGIEVLLDVVYNHTAEGNHLGPTLSLRGIDNSVYYWLVADDPYYYMDYTGTGNTLNVCHPRVLQLIIDSLRYWVQEMHVDGFRFDLAVTLGRTTHGFDHHAAFFAILQQDPLLSQVKLIAEPWDIAEGGYHVGNFPPGWSEWNGKYRDTLRRFWNGFECDIREVAHRLSGSPDLYAAAGRRPWASINFVTAHDGFTLRDLVSYAQKHNEANGEQNRDGDDYNHSHNYGVEGPTNDPEINAIRQQQQRNFLATLLLSQGTPMLLAGDELNRTQQGNNNAYCQDNEISWVDWQLDEIGQALLAFVRHLVLIRRQHPALQRPRFFRTNDLGDDMPELTWWHPDGRSLIPAELEHVQADSIGMLLNGHRLHDSTATGQRITDDNLLLLLNPNPQTVSFVLPGVASDLIWEAILDTAVLDAHNLLSLRPGEAYPLQGRALVLLRQQQQIGGYHC